MANTEWDAFPDDDDDDEFEQLPTLALNNYLADTANDSQEMMNEIASVRIKAVASAGTLYLTQHFCKTFHVPLNTCRVAFVLHGDDHVEEYIGTMKEWLSGWNQQLSQRGIQPIHPLTYGPTFPTQSNAERSSNQDLFDVVLLVNATNATSLVVNRHLVPGGLVFLMTKTSSSESVLSMEPNVWSASMEVFSEGTQPSLNSFLTLTAWSKLLCPINTDSCRHWLPSKHSLATEQTQLNQATVVPSAAQCISVLKQAPCTTPSSLLILSTAQHQKATTALASCGYCIIRRILDPGRCEAYGQAVLQDLHAANSILQQTFQVDVYQPQTNPDSYRELSMREDLRMDLRDGPKLRQLRSDTGHLFWQQPDLVRILQHVMYPRRDEFRHGNFGRYNFDGIPEEEDVGGDDKDEEKDEPYPTLKLSSVGGIISLPGAADQAIHADTPHLFEHENCLPAHYMNAFTAGCYHDDPRVGGTAFIHGSHQLSFTAKYCPTSNTVPATTMTTLKEEMYAKYLVRPWLQPGDVLLFDCRVLHFGLANRGEEARPVIYTNITHAWFHDPKNWDDRQAIFDPQHYNDNSTAATKG